MDRKLTFAFFGRDVSAGRTMNGLAGQTESLRSRTLQAAKAMSVLAGGAAIAGVTSALKTGFNELQDYQSGLSQLKAGLKSTHGAAGVSAKAMEDLASKIQDYSGQTDDSIVKTEQLLLTFTNIRNAAGKNNDIFTQTTKIAADMAARLGGDASGAAIQLGKALNDPVKGITALTRVGVSFDAQQRKQITHLAEHNHVLAAQKIILKELNKEFGGSARAWGKTLPGQIARTKRAYEDITQELATDLLPYALRFTKWVRKDAIPGLRDLGGWIKSNSGWLKPLAVGLAGVAASVKIISGVRKLTGAVGGAAKVLGGGGLVASAKPIPVYVTNLGPGGLGGGNGPVPTGGSKVGGVARTVGKAVGALAIGDAIAEAVGPKLHSGGILTAFHLGQASSLNSQLRSYIPGGSNYDQGSPRQQHALRKLFPEAQAAAAAGAKGNFGPAIKAVQDFEAAYKHAYDVESRHDVGKLLKVQTKSAADGADNARNHFGQFGNLLTAGIPRATGRASGALDGLIGKLGRASGEARSAGFAIGSDLGQGLISGIEERVPHATVAGKILVQQTVKQMRLAADAHSPSRETAKLGKDLADGLLVGWLGASHKVFASLAKDTRHNLMQLHNDVVQARDYRSSTRSGLLGFADLANMGQQTDTFGAQMGSTNVRAYLRGQANSLKQFSHLLTRLNKAGLDKHLLAQFAQTGPDAIPAMRELLTSGHHGIQAVDRQERRVLKYAGRAADVATGAQYGDALHRDLSRLPKAIAHEMRREFRHLHITVSPSKLDRHHGKTVMAHL